MSTDPTEPQGGAERSRARQMSLRPSRPPADVPGYQTERLLGTGAYGEVWVALERNTGRRVAIKFYAHRGGLDWSLLSREVEKLTFLFADRYVVQLLGVGWDADPPYYIMEYLPRGSLAERIEQGPLPVDEAVAVFRDVAVGLLHAHGKGVLHCDLKPANILLDDDGKPRLADFGQSRLSHEQTPALGTLFYMAPEQADLEAQPDARWDVYALGALFYCMLTGSPPHRTADVAGQLEKTADLKVRLSRYRALVEQSPPPSAHRAVHGVDRMLADIIDRCLAPDPARRYPNVQAVLDALEARAARLARRPLMVLGAAGPALLLAVVSWFAWRGFTTAVEQSDRALVQRALESNGFAARYVARTAADELDRRFRLVEQVTSDREFRRAVASAMADPELASLARRLSQPRLPPEESAALREQFRANPLRRQLQERFAALIPPPQRPEDAEEVASWFFCDAWGNSVARVPEGRTLGMNFAWRSYFHGGPRDMPDDWRPAPSEFVPRTKLSAVFRSRATYCWMVAVSAPVFDDSPERRFLGVVAMTAEVGRFIDFAGTPDQFAVLVDRRGGEQTGVVIQHPLFDQLLDQQGSLPDRFQTYRVRDDDLPDARHPQLQEHYSDPLAADPEGGAFKRHWLARMEPVVVRGEPTGWVVIVQEAYDAAIGSTLENLKRGLKRYGIAALSFVALVMVGLWGLASQLDGARHTRARTKRDPGQGDTS